MTNHLLERVLTIIWKKTHISWNKQRLLARVVASLTGGRFPAIADAERPGQRMHEFIGRYRVRHRKFVVAERAAASRAAQRNGRLGSSRSTASQSKVALEEAIYHCQFGCTPASLPVRVTPPGLRPQTVEYVSSSLARENLSLVEANKSLRQLETAAIITLEGSLAHVKTEFQNAVSSEFRALVENDRQRTCLEQLQEECDCQMKKLKGLEVEKQQLATELVQRDEKLCTLGRKVGFAQFELFRERELFERERQKQQLKLEREKLRLEADVAQRERENAQLRLECNEKKEDIQAKEVDLLRVRAHIGRLHMEMACHSQQAQRKVLALERSKRSVERRQLEKEIVGRDSAGTGW
ncbi:hypothetical protein AB1Y20_011276 [Prymnesium parvum]|uniref:Uncharacterized protein n=1 Tax=Prymnesium parvum TaxID=97485 RepID=A0AB34IMR0_PRYPA|mmetsp:Transcript_7253/g.17563  ORF Transcript_7253/g.17563 Transcript_7253/m.17563 type:complete len:353 (+) Transcript_7253:245-1303(+)